MSISHLLNQTAHISSLLNYDSNRNQKSNSVAKRRYSESHGKIVKNCQRMKTQSATIDKYKDQPNKSYKMLTEVSQNMNNRSIQKINKYNLKCQINLSTYQDKLAAYEKNKRQILKDLGYVQKNKQNTKLNKQDTKLNKYNTNQHFLTSTLKHSLECYKLRKNEMNKKQVLNIVHKNDLMKNKNIIKSPLCAESMPMPKNVKLEEERKIFIERLDHQVRLQGKLRKLKMQITPFNKRELKNIINNIFSPYEYQQDKLMKVDYEQFQPYFASPQNLNNTVSSQIIAQKLIESYQMSQGYWKQKLYKKFNNLFIKDLFQALNSESKLQLDLKAFTKQINSYFGRNYLSKDLFKIYDRICPVTKINFIYIFSV